ncbi:P2X purinoceptor 7-like protein [Lates japonicus]|uniref:P2X purinoceptor 7-like protein n=1 Tax=Lates japonicus TaxID=270547 RepID=A0AAD3M5D7_LATJO|nr:P2X purinoceptor 7-like protein [Lates japonicus]
MENLCPTGQTSGSSTPGDSSRRSEAAGNSQGQPAWCVCQGCREMPSDIEKKCCDQDPPNCIAISAPMVNVLRERGRRNDSRTDRGEINRQRRKAAYRRFVEWKYESLGSRNREVIPSCCVWKIRNCFPDPQGQYTGFIPGRGYFD